MGHKVRFVVNTQYLDIWGDVDEIVEEEEVETEYATYEEAKKHADKNEEGWRGTYVEVYLDDKYYRDYKVR